MNAHNDYDLGRRFFYAWLIARAMETIPIHICSSEGAIFRASSVMLSHKDVISALKWEWPARKGTRNFSLFDRERENRDYRIFERRFWFVDIPSGTISASLISPDEMEEFGPKYAWPYGIERRAEFASKFDGWALCLAEKDLPADAASLLRTLGYPDAREEHGISSCNRGGRPKQVPNAIEAYRAAYPDGHGALPVKAVATQIRHTLATTKRALKELRETSG